MSDDTQLLAELHAHEHAISTHLVEGEVYDRDLLLMRAAQQIQTAQFAILEAGRLYSAIRAAEGPERFHALLEAGGHSPQTVASAIKVYSVMGIGPRRQLAGYGSSKALELIRTFDAAELDTIATGGEVGGITQDDVSKMSTRELREHLRRARTALKEQEQTQDALVQDRDQRIRKLEKLAKLGTNAPAADVSAEILRDLAECATRGVTALRTAAERMGQLGDILDEVDEETKAAALTLVQNLRTAAQALDDYVGA